MGWRLDQVIFQREAGRVVVHVDLFDPLGRLRREVFHPATPDPELALERVARALAQRGVRGPGRVRQRRGSALLPSPELQRLFLDSLES
ncbi:MAG: hypothetical protein C4333_09095 [Meiothermus sp.]